MGSITSTTLDFLRNLQENNNKDWFTEHKSTYTTSHQEAIQFAEQVMARMSSFDKLEPASGKKSLFRIYRDIRFSKDKSPYKSYWSGFFKRAGENRRGGFGFRIQPDNSYISGGFFGPKSDDLRLLRSQIAADANPLRQVLESDAFKDYFGELLGESLKSAPKGFDREHPDIDLLRHKQFIVKHAFTDAEVLAPGFEEAVAEGFSHMLPFFGVMTTYLTTNLDGESLL